MEPRFAVLAHGAADVSMMILLPALTLNTTYSISHSYACVFGADFSDKQLTIARIRYFKIYSRFFLFNTSIMLSRLSIPRYNASIYFQTIFTVQISVSWYIGYTNIFHHDYFDAAEIEYALDIRAISAFISRARF